MHKVYTLKEHIQKEGANENEVKYFYADGNNQLVKNTNYSPGTLYKTTSYDEDNKSVTEYKDKQGQVVMKRNSGDVDTYYVYNDLDFTGKPDKTLKEHSIAGQAVIPELYTYTYDHAGRVTKTDYQLNGQPTETLADMTASGSYDELGRLKIKKRHNTDTEQFDYNIRNWTTKITSGGFEENLYYNTKPSNIDQATPFYNGNICYNTWTYNGSTRGYQYNYDALNRYIGGYAFINNVLQVDYQYSESFNYDKMGNITSLTRFSAEDISDQLYLCYNGNQLKYVNDNGIQQSIYGLKDYQNKSNTQDEFAYDANGNMTKDLDRDIYTIRYNLLNLPDTVQFKNGNQIINKYDAGGQKLRSIYYTQLTELSVPLSEGEVLHPTYATGTYDYRGTAYVGNAEYGISKTFINQYGGYYIDKYTLSKVYNTEGYTDGTIIPDETNYRYGIRYNYYRRDHLGNNREVWTTEQVNYSGTLAAFTSQRTQYYPSGLPWAESEGQEVQNKKYNGKEWIEMHGYDMYDFVARGYYPALGSFTTRDPLCELKPWQSPYMYCSGNPVNRIDPDGRIDYKVSKNGYFYQANPLLDKVKSFFGVKDKNDPIIMEGSKKVISILQAGSIGKISQNDKSKTQFEIKGDKTAERVFKDVSRNTNVEWARIKHSTTKESNNTIVNQHDDENVSAAAKVALNFQKSGQNVSLLQHSHPLPDDFQNLPTFNLIMPPSGQNGESGDISTAKLFPNTIQRVFNLMTNRYEYYDKNGVYKTESAGD